MKKRTVALLGDGLYTWDGGVDYLSNIAGILEYVNDHWEDYDLKLYLVLPREYALVRGIRRVLSKGERNEGERFSYIRKVFADACKDVQVVYYRKHVKKIYDDQGKGLQKTLTKIGADICLPILRDYYPKLKTPWIGYVADFQEKYYPELFDKATLDYRENNTKCQVANTSYFVATSDSVKQDFEEFYPGDYKVFAQPFAPLAADSFIDTSSCDLSSYQLADKFFLISNQFWVHKSHITAFKALKHLYEKGHTDVHIYCTGKMNADSRDGSYSSQLYEWVQKEKLSSNIHFLGYIPKLDQIEIMKKSVALVQPSLFEGDPGGCSVYNANALLIPVIMADIRVNLEAEGTPGISLFKAGDEENLAMRMEEALSLSHEEASKQGILAHNKENAEKLAGFYMNMIEEVIKDYQPRE